MIPIGFLPNSARERMLQALLGQWAYNDPLNEEVGCTNSDPQAVQVDTITVDTATALNAYTFGITADGVEFTYTADSSTSTTEVATGIAAAWNNSALGDYAYATSLSAVVTLTGNTPGQAYTIDTVDPLTTLASVTAAAEAAAITFGRLVISGSTPYDSDAGTRIGVLCQSTKLVAQVDTITVDYAASEVYKIQITIEGETYLAEVDADTDDATTATNIRTAVNAMMPANTVIASGATDQVILTAEVAGKAFVTVVGVKSETVARLALVHTTATPFTDVNRVVLGCARRWSFVESTAVGASTPSYPANGGVICGRKGAMWVSNSQGPSYGDKVYVETAVGANAGLLYNTTSATRILLKGCRWERDERSSQSENLAVVRLNFDFAN